MREAQGSEYLLVQQCNGERIYTPLSSDGMGESAWTQRRTISGSRRPNFLIRWGLEEDAADDDEVESDGPLMEQEMAGFKKKGFNLNEVAVAVVVVGGQVQSHEEAASLLQPIEEEEEETETK